MSILKSLKGTFKSVQGDISEGLKSFATSPEKTGPQIRYPQTYLVNYEAGGELMHKHEEMWKELYQYSEDTARKAENLDIDIGNLFVACDKQSEVVGKLHQEAASLPILLNQLQEITNSLAAVEEEYDNVEAALVHLEDLCEQQEFRKNQASHHKQLAAYKLKKEHEIQRYRATLAKEHALKVEAANKKKQQLMKEKQSAYEEQFSQDVDYYKKHGKLGRQPSTPEPEKKLDIADVEIEEEEDKGALNAFLDTAGGDGNDPDDKTETDTDVVSDGDGPAVEITGEITSPSEAEVSTVVSPEKTDSQPSAEHIDDEPNSEDVKSPSSPSEDTDSSSQEHNQVDEKEQ